MFIDDLDLSKSLIHLKGQETIRILNYKKLLKYDSNEIIILLTNQKLFIIGKSLNICYFNEDELFVKGNIQSLQFHNRAWGDVFWKGSFVGVKATLYAY